MQRKLSKSLHIEAINLRHKAEVNWLSSGDFPSKFFYAKMSFRKHCNDIGKLLNNNESIINEASHLEKEAILYFSDLLILLGVRGTFPNITPKFLLHVNSEKILLAPICLDDIKILFSLLRMTKALVLMILRPNSIRFIGMK